MFSKTIQEVIAITKTHLIGTIGEGCVSRICINSSQVAPGDTFVAFKGERVDGNTFALDALAAGASCVVLTAEASKDVRLAAEEKHATLLYTKDAEVFLQRLARAYRAEKNWLVLAVTGSVGKTTTKEFVTEALSAQYKTYATPGNFNSVIGVPLSILKAPDDTEVFVCEMGMNHTGEIDIIASCARPHAAIITNIGMSHIGNVGSRENIARAKAEVVPWLADPLPSHVSVEPTLVMPDSDEWTTYIARHFAKPSHVKVERVGKDTYRVDGVELVNGCPHCVIWEDKKCYPISLSLPGKALVEDALLAFSLARIAGISAENALRAIERVKHQTMRREVLLTHAGASVINDAYNASPASVQDALLLLQTYAPKKRIALLGEMGELGDFAETEHRKIAQFAAQLDLDVVIFVGPTFATLMKESARASSARENHKEVFSAGSREEALELLKTQIDPESVVLVKGSRFLELDKVVEEVIQTC